MSVCVQSCKESGDSDETAPPPPNMRSLRVFAFLQTTNAMGCQTLSPSLGLEREGSSLSPQGELSRQSLIALPSPPSLSQEAKFRSMTEEKGKQVFINSCSQRRTFQRSGAELSIRQRTLYSALRIQLPCYVEICTTYEMLRSNLHSPLFPLTRLFLPSPINIWKENTTAAPLNLKCCLLCVLERKGRPLPKFPPAGLCSFVRSSQTTHVRTVYLAFYGAPLPPNKPLNHRITAQGLATNCIHVLDLKPQRGQ